MTDADRDIFYMGVGYSHGNLQYSWKILTAHSLLSN